MTKNKKTKIIVTKNIQELASALGIDHECDIALMEYKAQLSILAVKAIKDSNLSVNDVVQFSGVARSKVSAVKNGALAGISCDLFIKIISATGARLIFKMAS
jgi:predicted XRE-type DNA-binding protein